MYAIATAVATTRIVCKYRNDISRKYQGGNEKDQKSFHNNLLMNMVLLDFLRINFLLSFKNWIITLHKVLETIMNNYSSDFSKTVIWFPGIFLITCEIQKNCWRSTPPGPYSTGSPRYPCAASISITRFSCLLSLGPGSGATSSFQIFSSVLSVVLRSWVPISLPHSCPSRS